ncbi:MAG: type II toxin-antitoxin system HicB family antitoxin [Candidatus Bathyarchaeota archaeon]|nr:type II toxin-antitoxin system HicB family antitoxin [Candidatus Bathyarchaeota archaeon]
MKIFVCLEVGQGGTGVFVPECSGCWVFGRTPERALEKVKVGIEEWFEWLKRHGEKIPTEASKFAVEVGEILRVNYNPVEAGKPEPLFWSEVAPIRSIEIARTIRLLGYSRSDLFNLVSGLGNEILDWQPSGKPRTIRNTLKHIGFVEWWYITRLDVELPAEFPKDVFNLLNYTRKIVTDYLQDFPKEKRSGVFQPKRDVGRRAKICNLWTARKVLRRLVDHERLHTRYIEKVLRMYRS